MRGTVKKEEAACKTSVSVKINGILKFLEHSKFGGGGGVDSFWNG
jgi:hypothetical protein